MNDIKFHKYFVTDGKNKARVYYSRETKISGQKYITLREKDYADNLPKLFSGVRNDSDGMTDYFENNSIRFMAGTPEYDLLSVKLADWGIM